MAEYCGCYMTDDPQPFGYCKKCWIEAGKPGDELTLINLLDIEYVIVASLIKPIQGATFDAPKPIKEGEANANPVPPKPNEIEEKKQEEEMAMKVKQQLLTTKSDGGWFQSMFGRGAESLVKDLRMARREHKGMKDAIDEAIFAIRIAKKQEVEATLSSLEWIGKHESTVKSLGISDRDLQALRKHGQSREYALRRACVQWEKANDVISKLLLIGYFNDDQIPGGQLKNAKRMERGASFSCNIKKTDANFNKSGDCS